MGFLSLICFFKINMGKCFVAALREYRNYAGEKRYRAMRAGGQNPSIGMGKCGFGRQGQAFEHGSARPFFTNVSSL